MKKKEYNKQYYVDNKEKIREQQKEYNEINKEVIIKKRHNYYHNTQYGKAIGLLHSYKHNDIIHNRGECTLTAKWIIDNIFSSKCIYCGEDDWTKLGCDRIDNDKPHTPDNVVCSCWKHNKQRKNMNFEEFKKIMLGEKNS